MTVDEIKRTYSMRDVAERYGFHPNRAGFIPCPFHKEKAGSMKIYKESFYCFGCQCSGDIFTFVQKMDNCDFKAAFYSLGGTYQKPTASSKLAVYHAKKAKENKIKQEQELKRKMVINTTMIHAAKALIKKSKPLSDEWWYYMDIYHMELLKAENLEGSV